MAIGTAIKKALTSGNLAKVFGGFIAGDVIGGAVTTANPVVIETRNVLPDGSDAPEGTLEYYLKLKLLNDMTRTGEKVNNEISQQPTPQDTGSGILPYILVGGLCIVAAAVIIPLIQKKRRGRK